MTAASTNVPNLSAVLKQAEHLDPELRGRTVHSILPHPLPFPDASFQCITSWAVLIHLTLEQLPAALREISRVLSPDGVFAYSVNTARPNLDEHGSDPSGRHFTCLPAAGWERLHHEAGFQTVHMVETDDITGREGVRWVTFTTRSRAPTGGSED